MTTTQTKPRPCNPFPRKRFGAIDVTFDAIASLLPAVALLRKRDRHLADQISRALTNVSLNLGEGSYRSGGNRALAYRRAAGEAHEAMVGLEAAVVWGHLTVTDVAEGVGHLRHVLSILAKVR